MKESSKANGEEITEKSTKEDAEEGAPDYPFHPLVIAAQALKKATLFRASDVQAEKRFVFSSNTRLFVEVKKSLKDD